MPRKIREFSRRDPLYQGLDRTVWHPELVGKVRNYSRTEEAFKARQAAHRANAAARHATGKFTRKGIPDGWAGQREQLQIVREWAEERAEKEVNHMIETGVLAAGTTDEDMGNEAIQAALAIVRAKDDDGKPAYTGAIRVSAMRLVADFCKSRPITRVAASVIKAEDWLTALAASAGTTAAGD